MSKMKCKRLCVMLTLSLLLVCVMGTTAFAAGTGDVAGAVESTWQTCISYTSPRPRDSGENRMPSYA